MQAARFEENYEKINESIEISLYIYSHKAIKWNTNDMDLQFLIEKPDKMDHKHAIKPYPASPPSPNGPKNGRFGEEEDSREQIHLYYSTNVLPFQI